MPLDRGKLSSVLMTDIGAEKHRRGNPLYDRYPHADSDVDRHIHGAAARVRGITRSETPRICDACSHERTRR